MALTKNEAHQWALASVKEVPLADFSGQANTTIEVCEVPGDAIILGVSINVEEAVSGGTITDAKATFQLARAGGDVALSAAIDIDATAGVFSAPVDSSIAGEVCNVEVDVALTGSGPTAGKFYATVLYVRKDRANELRG